MPTSSLSKLAESDMGHGGQPGGGYTDRIARLSVVAQGGYELYVRSAWGSNQGYLEEHGRTERRFRAGTLDNLMRIGISEVTADSEFDGRETAQLVAAIRDATFDAQDAEAEAEAEGDAAGRS